VKIAAFTQTAVHATANAATLCVEREKPVMASATRRRQKTTSASMRPSNIAKSVGRPGGQKSGVTPKHLHSHRQSHQQLAKVPSKHRHRHHHRQFAQVASTNRQA